MCDQNKTRDELIAELLESRREAEFFRAIVEGCDDAIQVVRGGSVFWTNQASVDQSGYSKEEWYGMDLRDIYFPEDLGRLGKVLYDFHESPSGTAIKVVFRVRAKDGRTQWMEASMVRRPEPPLEGTVAVARVVSGRNDPPRELKLSSGAEAPSFDLYARDEALGAIFNNVSDAIIVHDREGAIHYINKTALDMLGLGSDQVRPDTSADEFYLPEGASRDTMLSLWRRALSGESIHEEWRIARPDDSSLRDVAVLMRRISVDEQESVLVVISDITYRKQAEERLKSMLAEKEALLRETHHRVKNNFALISGLLRLQARRARDSRLEEMLKEADFRVRCMGKVHEKLHQSESLSALRIREYLIGLVDNLIATHGDRAAGVRVTTNIEEVSLTAETAVPLGFITSELCSNCFKHAFPDKGGGVIEVGLHRTSGTEFELIVRDNGVGLPDNLDIEALPSLGLKLLKSFVDQLEGTLSVCGEGGAEFRVRFTPPLRESSEAHHDTRAGSDR